MSETKAPDSTGKAPNRRKLVAVVYADMVGYSRLIGLDDQGTLERLRTLRSNLIDPAIDEHSGRIVQTGGDSLLIVFDSIDGAVRCAMKVQQHVPTHDGDHAPDRAIRFRVGINIGDAIPDGTDLHGDAVNVVARLQAECPAGGICVTRPVRDHVQDRLNLAFEELGALHLKNIARPVEAFVLRLDPAAEIGQTLRSSVTQAVTPPDVGLSNAPRLSVVVLPFDNFGGSDVEDYIVDGITDDLTTDISRLPDFLVIARNSAFTYKGKAINIKRVGEELGVRYAVQGSVRIAGHGLRINAQLVSTETGAHLWADRFDVGREGVGYGVDDIVRHIVVALNVRVLDIESARGARERPANPDTADILLRVRALRITLPPNPQKWTEITALCQRALELDPSSVVALTGLADALLDSIEGGPEDPTVPATLRRAEELITRAEMLRPDDLGVMWVRQYLLGVQGRYAEAIPAAQRTIEAYPNQSGPHLWLGTCLMRTGRSAEAIPEFEWAIRLNPRDPYIYNRYRNTGYALLFLGRYDEAISWFRRSLASHPSTSAWNRSNTLAAMAAAQALAGYIEEARVSAVEASRLWPALTVRGHYRCNCTLAHLEQVARMREGLRLAGLRDHADEDVDLGLGSDDILHTNYEAATPITVPGARTIRTPDLAALLEKQPGPVVLDATFPWGRSVPGAVGLWGGGVAGDFSDEYQRRLETKVQQLTHGDLNTPVIAMGWNAERYQGRNLALRLIALGYTNVHWYRGGREAWEVSGLPETELVMQDW